MLITEVREHLENKIIPFWRSLRDDESGGYYGYVDADLNVDKKADKGCILNSRIMWFFSSAYKILKKEELLDEASHAYDFMKKCCLDSHFGGVFWMLDYRGKPVEDMKHTYNQAFAIYALSSYYEASRDQEALDLALGLFYRIESVCRDEFGYEEAFDRSWHLIDNRKLSDNRNLEAEGKVAEKTMNTILHLIEAYTELYRVSKAAEVGYSLRQLLEMVYTKVYNREKRQLEVFFNARLEPIVNMHSYGHDIEAAWLLDRAAEVLGDEEVIREIRNCTTAIAYKIKEIAFTDHGLNNERFNNKIDTTRIWWVQAETLTGFLNAYEKTKDAGFLKAVWQQWNYIKKVFIDSRQDSEWFEEADEKGSPDRCLPMVRAWKCPYHNGRMCLEVIRRGIDV